MEVEEEEEEAGEETLEPLSTALPPAAASKREEDKLEKGDSLNVSKSPPLSKPTSTSGAL